MTITIYIVQPKLLLSQNSVLTNAEQLSRKENMSNINRYIQRDAYD